MAEVNPWETCPPTSPGDPAGEWKGKITCNIQSNRDDRRFLQHASAIRLNSKSGMLSQKSRVERYTLELRGILCQCNSHGQVSYLLHETHEPRKHIECSGPLLLTGFIYTISNKNNWLILIILSIIISTYLFDPGFFRIIEDPALQMLWHQQTPSWNDLPVVEYL